MTQDRLLWLAARLVERLAPAELRAPIAGDLIEEYALRRQDEGALRANRWICAQLFCSIPFLARMTARRDSWHVTVAVAAIAWLLFGRAEVQLTSAALAALPSGQAVPVVASLLIGLGLASLVGALSALVKPPAATLFSAFTIVSLVALMFMGAPGSAWWQHLVFLSLCPFAISAGRRWALRARRNPLSA